ncbi:MAG: RusA family crossover junction endodeoxyribonuclease [Elusimicrobiota bacterium]|jgi:Holliday junction resolvase RusA-like endonuclease|nr:RusA family crossover junction endodeoxyribonuclease [Elusimicrobiota bacterium]
MRINFTVWGEPTAKGRPRFARRGKFITTYTPQKTMNAENDFKLQSLKYKPVKPLDLPIAIEIRVFRSIPASWSVKKQFEANRGTIKPITKPDCDNYTKLILDAMNQIFFRDDSQIVRLQVEKAYSCSPRIEISMTELEDK